jgi:exodeoxyribonuclease-5
MTSSLELPNIVWTPEQERALKMCGDWLRGPEQEMRVFGYAGTGKTTIARHLAATSDGVTLFAAYTGKAANVMRKSGCAGATTLHSLLYKPSQGSTEEVHRLQTLISHPDTDPRDLPELRYDLRAAKEKADRPVFSLNEDSPLRGASLLVVDEVSMVNADMKRDILSFGIKVLVLGDPAQLPPVSGEEGAFTSLAPHILLTDIQRQAKDNAIIRWATKVREGGIIDFGTDGECRKIRKTSISAGDLLLRSGQLLTGKNETRRKLNAQARKLMGASGPYPNKGETLVCLKNDHRAGFLNGVTCVAASTAQLIEDALVMDLYYEDMELKDVEANTVPFDLYENPDAEAETGYWDRMRYQKFDFGYCLTVHKAQGSQWDKVTICDDGFGKRGGPTERARWLYTAITRAQRELVIVQ